MTNEIGHDGHESHFESTTAQLHKCNNYERALRLANEPYPLTQGRARIEPSKPVVTQTYDDGQYVWHF